MKEQEITLGEMFEFAVENLPREWELTLTMVEGGADLSLIDPGGKPVIRCQDDMDTGEMIEDYVNAAREEEGLGPVRLVTVDPALRGWTAGRLASAAKLAEAERDELIVKASALNAAVLRCMPYVVPGKRVPDDRQAELHGARKALSEAVSRINGKAMVQLAEATDGR